MSSLYIGSRDVGTLNFEPIYRRTGYKGLIDRFEIKSHNGKREAAIDAGGVAREVLTELKNSHEENLKELTRVQTLYEAEKEKMVRGWERKERKVLITL